LVIKAPTSLPDSVRRDVPLRVERIRVLFAPQLLWLRNLRLGVLRLYPGTI
jgi:hypothetical protein